MASRKRASLSLYSRTVTLQEFTGELGPPSRSREMGATRGTGKPSPFTFWSWESALTVDSMEVLVADVVVFAEAHQSPLQAWGDLIEKKRIFCALFLDDRAGAPGFALSSELLARIGELHLDLDVDIL